MEDFGLVKEVVVVTGALAELCGVVTGITGNDAVYEGAVHAAGLFEPCAEIGTEVPKVDVLTDALLEVLAVFEDELAGEDDEALVLCAVEVLETVVQELGELSGIGAGGLVVKLACGVEGDAGLGGVGNHEADFGLLGEFEVGLEIGIGVDTAGDDVDEVDAVYGLSVLEALEVQMVEAVLLVEPLDHTLLDGLDYNHGAVEIGLLVGLPDYPLNECAEEVAFAKLNHLFGVLFCLRCRRAV